MKEITAMEILKRCRDAEKDLRELDIKIERRRDILTNTGAPQGDPNGGGRSRGGQDKTGRLVAEIDELERLKEERKQERAVEQAALVALLDDVPELEGRVLYASYMKREKPEAIAKRLHMSAAYVRKKKRDGEEVLGLLSTERVRSVLPKWYLEREEVRR